MARRAAVERWLTELTRLPTASGLEQRVAAWVGAWVSRRPDLAMRADSGGNLMITQKRRHRRSPLLAVAHMDHPAFVSLGSGRFVFRGGVDPAYFDEALIETVSPPRGDRFRVASYDPDTQTGRLLPVADAVMPDHDDILMWVFGPNGAEPGMHSASACDDLAGVAACLAALDRVRGQPAFRHFGVLLTRAEEVGLIGAIHAARNRTVPEDTRIISIETSRELPTAPVGAGPIIRTGDRPTVFDREMTNLISQTATHTGLRHQRRLMDGGGCEATAFGAYGYRSAGLCVALRNWHNRGNLDAVQSGAGPAVAMREEISLADFHGLVDLIVLAAAAVDEPDGLVERLDALYESQRHLLEP